MPPISALRLAMKIMGKADNGIEFME